MVVLILTVLVIYVTMVYGPIAAALVELFPTRIRYTGMSLPYHIGNGWFGGLLPATAFAMVAQTGDIYFGLWYPIVIALDDLRHRHAVRAGDQGPRHLRGRQQVSWGGRLEEGRPLRVAGPFSLRARLEQTVGPPWPSRRWRERLSAMTKQPTPIPIGSL